MKIVILTSDTPAQVALCTKISSINSIEHIFVTELEQKNNKKWKLLGKKVLNRLIGWPLISAWRKMEAHYAEAYFAYPEVPITKVARLNDANVIQQIVACQPDLVIVSGTELLKQDLVSIVKKSSRGIINLHTGISPHIKGGPNCTNWCLALNLFYLIGNTVMYLDLGIDTGHIIASEQTPLRGDETLSELHFKVMEHAHALYLKVIQSLQTCDRLPSISQNEIGERETVL